LEYAILIIFAASQIYPMNFIWTLLIPVLSLYQSDLVKTSIINNKVELKVPKQLTKMSDEMWKVKYHSKTRPIMVLTDDKGEVNLIADQNIQLLADEQLAAYNDFQIKQFKKTHPDMILRGSGIKTVNKKKIGFLKFTTSAVDQKVFNYYFFTSFEGKLLLFSFNCIESLRPTWEKTADQVVESLRIK
jgi:hypothetical protein